MGGGGKGVMGGSGRCDGRSNRSRTVLLAVQLTA